MINNAGVGGPTKLVEDVTDEEWDHCMSICIDAQFTALAAWPRSSRPSRAASSST